MILSYSSVKVVGAMMDGIHDIISSGTHVEMMVIDAEGVATSVQNTKAFGDGPVE